MLLHFFHWSVSQLYIVEGDSEDFMQLNFIYFGQSRLKLGLTL